MASNGNIGEEIDNSGEELVATVEHDLKRWTQPLKDHFKKIHEVACPHHLYPVKHKLMDYTIMKKLMTSGNPSSGNGPRRDSGGKRAGPHPRETEVTTITSWSHPKTRDATWLVETQAPLHVVVGDPGSGMLGETLPTLCAVPCGIRE
jgi:hypothetical protein